MYTMQFETFKNFAVCATHLFVFCIGLENGVIIPSILQYLDSLGSKYEAILGIALAGYGVSNRVSTRILRHLVDKSYSVRSLLVLCSTAYVIGGIFYCYGKSWWGVVLARCCSGFGSGAITVITSDISRNILEIEMLGVYRQIHYSLVFGWVISPVLGLALCSLHPQGMNEYATPGLVCITIFLLCGVLSATKFCDLGRTLRFCRLRQSLSLAYERYSTTSSRYGAIVDSSSSSASNESCAKIYGLWSSHTEPQMSGQVTHKRPTLDLKRVTLAGEKAHAADLTNSDEILETAEDLMGEPCTPLKSEFSEKNSAFPSAMSTPGEMISEPFFNKIGILRKGACACYNIEKAHWLGPEFLAAFFFGCIQTMMTPLTSQFFMFGCFENALVQLVLGFAGVVPILLTAPHGNRSLHLGGCLIAALSLCWLLAPAVQVGNVGSLPAFSVGMLGLSVACGLLFTSCTPLDPEAQFQTPWAWSVGLVLGPLWAASTAPQPCLLLGAQLCLVLLATTRSLC